jgi:Tol biopolymer transport system component
MAAPPEELEPGRRILHYQLVEKLGQGGMGVVWKATDASLDRAVALKALPSAFSADPERLARFEREARLLASLNHPNIATVYSVHQVDGVRYLSMELVPGEDLAQRIARGPVPVPEALEIARQIAVALEAAHESGVVHRDLKPANIRITPDGRVKVLDFGLAKAMDPDTRSSSLSASPTHAISAMTGNMIIGTAAYMSPEQARGQGADRRADIWSFGVVLYEMLTGTRAFDGDTVSDTLAAVLRAEPDRAKLPADVPARLRSLLDRCLEKNARRRLRDIGEAVVALEDLIAGGVAAEPASAAAANGSTRAARAWWPVAVAVLALVVAGVAWLRPAARPQPLRKLTLSLRSAAEPLQGSLSLSPDGSRVAFFQGTELWVRDLAQLESRKLAENGDTDFEPTWSPDGSSIAFVRGSTLVRVGLATGAVSPICSFVGFTGGSRGIWGADGRILFTAGSDHVYEVPQAGGTPKILIPRLDSLEVDLHHPVRLPGKDAFVCVIHTPLGGPNVLAVVEAGGKRHPLLEVPGGTLQSPVYDHRGYLLYARTGDGGGIWAMPFSVARLRATGEPFLVAPGAGWPTIDVDGTLAYRPGEADRRAQVVVVDRQGAVKDTIGGVVPGLWSLSVSPDGRMLAVEVRDASEGDILGYDLERRTVGRLAFGPGRQLEPAWSADGRTLVYRDLTLSAVMVAPADGSRSPRAVAKGVQPRFMPDGRHVVTSLRGAGGIDIMMTPLVAGADSLRVPAPGVDNYPVPAPHAPFLAYTSDESGSDEVYLRPWPGGEGRWQVSTNGGSLPQWSPSGDRLYYRHDARWYEVDVQLVPSVRLGTPRILFDLELVRVRSFARHTIVPTRDPNRFYAIREVEGEQHGGIDAVVVQNWLAEFERRR